MLYIPHIYRQTIMIAKVEPLNKGHFGTAIFVLCKEGVLLGRLKMHKNYREELFWDLKLYPL